MKGSQINFIFITFKLYELKYSSLENTRAFQFQYMYHPLRKAFITCKISQYFHNGHKVKRKGERGSNSTNFCLIIRTSKGKNTTNKSVSNIDPKICHPKYLCKKTSEIFHSYTVYGIKYVVVQTDLTGAGTPVPKS